MFAIPIAALTIIKFMYAFNNNISGLGVEVKKEPAPAPVVEVKEEPAPAPVVEFKKEPAPAPVVEVKKEPAPAPVVEVKKEPGELGVKKTPFSYIVCNGLTNQLFGHAGFIASAIESGQDILLPDTFITNGVQNDKESQY